jgi:uncharacterized protein YcbK (DUF882 family)
MASALDKALAILAKEDPTIKVQINFGFRTISENAALRPRGAPDSLHLVGEAVDIHFDKNWDVIQKAMHDAGLYQGTGTEAHHFQVYPWGDHRDTTPQQIQACTREHPNGT